jgi:hypothetical protein
MSQIAWDLPGARIFEDGVDRAVLYPHVGNAVAWNGLVSVSEGKSGGDVESFYYDGVKYLGVASSQEFEATINAFTYPDEFESCLGVEAALNGILVTNQAPKLFGLCYRTLVGNDINGLDHGYKLHLIYNALAVPSDKSYGTLTSTPSPTNFSWSISTTPPVVPGFRPSAHLILDSTKIDPDILETLEGILYGVSAPPRLLTPAEILSAQWIKRMIVVIESPNPALLPPSAESGDYVFSVSDEAVYTIDGPPTNNSREVIVFTDDTEEQALGKAYPGDLLYDEETGVLYQLGS